MVSQPLFAQQPPWLKLISLLIITFASLLFVTLAGMLVALPIFGKDMLENAAGTGDLGDPAILARLKYLQIVSQIGLFIVPVIAFTFLVTRQKAAYLGFTVKRALWPMLAASVIMFAGLPLINWLLELNMQLKLPASWSGLEQWMRRSEEDAGRLTEAFIQTPSVGSFLLNLLMMAVIPAIGEEMLFRGLIQRLCREWFKNIHLAIMVSAAIFAFVHFQFFGFLPRFLMGVLFGYMVYWSGSLWVPIIAHFMNNATAVVVAFLSARWLPGTDFNTFGRTESPWIILGSALLVSLICTALWLNRKKEVPPISLPNN